MKKILFVILLLSPAIGTWAASDIPILALGGGARANALNGAYTAAAGDIDSLDYNPAGLAAMSRPEFGVTHADLLLGSSFNQISYAYPSDAGTWGVGVRQFQSGVIEGRDQQGQTSGQFQAVDRLGALAYARPFGSNFGAGAEVKYIQSQLANQSAAGTAFDAGIVAKLPSRPLWFGLSVQNVGSNLTYISQKNPLPTAVSVGAAFQIGPSIKMALDVKHTVPDSATELLSGVEVSVLPTVALRAGYLSPISMQSAQVQSFGRFQGGAGLRLGQLQLDYALMPFADLGAEHRFTVSSRF